MICCNDGHVVQCSTRAWTCIGLEIERAVHCARRGMRQTPRGGRAAVGSWCSAAEGTRCGLLGSSSEVSRLGTGRTVDLSRFFALVLLLLCSGVRCLVWPFAFSARCALGAAQYQHVMPV